MQQLMMSLFAPIHCACSILTAFFCQMAGLQTFETNALGSCHGHPPRPLCPSTASAAAEDVTLSAFFHVEHDRFLGDLRCSDLPTDLSPSSSNVLVSKFACH
ncbi:hypothetical protein T12_9299 [Trichinella patagoniensis]|uniref:Secreted protein n=1 Tax=Trichinella patagoniensis TaxID=990121 RepID=A0A0V0YSK3_9BILA|nr:hypothetical protein T12_9299 [Trichinella patagoniensis]